MKFVKWIESQKTSKLLRIFMYIALFIVVVIDFFIERQHIEFFWDMVPGFSAFYGFISCAVIIVVSKAVGRAWLMKKEDYYD